MKITHLKKALLVIAISAISQFSLADDASSSKAIASILVNLSHFPSAEAKATLMGISHDASTSDSLKAVAKAVHDMQHQASADDKAALGEIASGDSAKALAEIVAGIMHTPSADAKTQLQAML
ncbi:MAG: hypothetical protein COC19_07340 [SAR86 cluster bacterium]|uniref:Uncharacterized protein n=1 Tax=SAR86 cluster bacterium TaxID=2030880 RepID=A0A2A4MH85_9GAMM|nr:MAG: hypothetical protein COC19_07340 [SAR86 cluster bacterium]